MRFELITIIALLILSSCNNSIENRTSETIEISVDTINSEIAYIKESVQPIYYLNQKVFYIRDSTSMDSPIIDTLVFNEEIHCLEETNSIFQWGCFTGNWMLIKKNNKLGYCPSVFLTAYQFQTETHIKDARTLSFLMCYFDSSQYTYTYSSSDTNYLTVEAVYIKNINIKDVYLMFRDFGVIDKESPFPLEQKHYSNLGDYLELEVMTTTFKDSPEIETLSLEYTYEGGESSCLFYKYGTGISIVIVYNPD